MGGKQDDRSEKRRRQVNTYTTPSKQQGQGMRGLMEMG